MRAGAQKQEHPRLAASFEVRLRPAAAASRGSRARAGYGNDDPLVLRTVLEVLRRRSNKSAVAASVGHSHRAAADERPPVCRRRGWWFVQAELAQAAAFRASACSHPASTPGWRTCASAAEGVVRRARAGVRKRSQARCLRIAELGRRRRAGAVVGDWLTNRCGERPRRTVGASIPCRASAADLLDSRDRSRTQRACPREH